jgi:hypothetical protein
MAEAFAANEKWKRTPRAGVRPLVRFGTPWGWRSKS